MDIKYFYSHIMEELHGAREYAERAVAVSTSHPTWSKMFADMSAIELSHANSLYKMMDELCSEPNASDWLCEYKAKTAEYISEEAAKIKRLHEMLK